MTSKLAHGISAALVAVVTLASMLAYPDMADRVPTHWNAAGEVDGYSSRLKAAALGPSLALGVWIVMWAIPKISPKGFRTSGFTPVINLFQVVLVAFMAGIGGIIIAAGLGHSVSVEWLIPLGTGLLMIILGNYLNKVRKNFFVGIRTPWTLASDEVWARTHRLGGYLFVAAGALIAVSGLWSLGTTPIVVIAISAGLIPVFYSFFLYRKLEGFDDD